MLRNVGELLNLIIRFETVTLIAILIDSSVTFHVATPVQLNFIQRRKGRGKYLVTSPLNGPQNYRKALVLVQIT